jgi:hypothetical protein
MGAEMVGLANPNRSLRSDRCPSDELEGYIEYLVLNVGTTWEWAWGANDN